MSEKSLETTMERETNKQKPNPGIENFLFQNRTKILFGKGHMSQIAQHLPADAHILMVYGQGSIKRNGIYETLSKALQPLHWTEFGGIPPNPEYSVLMKAVEVIKREKIDYILAVGGGSVIDGVKFLAAAAKYTDSDPWDILRKNIIIDEDHALPFSTVLTIPASGSEMNGLAVLSRSETGEKLAMTGFGIFPVFSILDPTVIASLPPLQIANGVTDAFVHVLEQYVTYPVGALIQDRFAESVIQTLIEVGPQVLKTPSDYHLASNFMWACTMAISGVCSTWTGLISVGVPADWGVHLIGHELTARFGIDHAQSLAIVLPGYYMHQLSSKQDKLAQFATRVWGIQEGSTTDKATAAILATERFFQSLGIKTRLSEYTKEFEGTAEAIAAIFTKRGTILGERKNLFPEDVVAILKSRY
jgi:NADP-dependent alcohol dehydrogenase